MINDYSQIKQVVSVLVHDFTLSSSANTRKGGLVGLAATAIALGRVSRSIIDQSFTQELFDNCSSPIMYVVVWSLPALFVMMTICICLVYSLFLVETNNLL